jgi:hypothetical protein
LRIAGPSVVRADGFSRTRPGREQEPRSEPQGRQPTVPRHRFLMPRCAQASPALGGEQASSALGVPLRCGRAIPEAPLRVAALRRSSLEIVDASKEAGVRPIDRLGRRRRRQRDVREFLRYPRMRADRPTSLPITVRRGWPSFSSSKASTISHVATRPWAVSRPSNTKGNMMA